MAISITPYSDKDRDALLELWSKALPLDAITVDMVLASASIPLLFPPVQVGRHLLWDGGLLVNTPLAPVVALGADEIIPVLVTEPPDPERGALVVVPTIDGKRGNPVVWSRRFFPDLMAISGDIGARHLIGSYAEAVVEVPVADDAALTDVDTPESLSAVKAEIERA